jgi:hypothetical protein
MHAPNDVGVKPANDGRRAARARGATTFMATDTYIGKNPRVKQSPAEADHIDQELLGRIFARPARTLLQDEA